MIYLITYNRCPFQYVVETAKKFNKMFKWHRAGFKQPGKYGFCRIRLDHFHKNVSCNASHLVQILEKLKGNGRTTRNALDTSITSRRKQCEKTWMLKLKNIYPMVKIID